MAAIWTDDGQPRRPRAELAARGIAMLAASLAALCRLLALEQQRVYPPPPPPTPEAPYPADRGHPLPRAFEDAAAELAAAADAIAGDIADGVLAGARARRRPPWQVRWLTWRIAHQARPLYARHAGGQR